MFIWYRSLYSLEPHQNVWPKLRLRLRVFEPMNLLLRQLLQPLNPAKSQQSLRVRNLSFFRSHSLLTLSNIRKFQNRIPANPKFLTHNSNILKFQNPIPADPKFLTHNWLTFQNNWRTWVAQLNSFFVIGYCSFPSPSKRSTSPKRANGVSEVCQGIWFQFQSCCWNDLLVFVFRLTTFN